MQFRNALAGRGIIPPADLVADGKIHRCDVEGKNGKGDGAYLLHLDGIAAGGFENHKDGLEWENWRADVGRTLTPGEMAEHRAKVDAARQQRHFEEIQGRAEAAQKAAVIWKAATLAEDHQYLTKKSVTGHGARLHNDALVIPLRDTSGAFHSLQFISPEGDKRFLAGGRVQGCYYSFGKPDGVLCIAEGFATGASIHQATGHAVAVAFNAGNLLPVARALRRKFPNLKLVLCADDDCQTEGNPGRTKAKEAAQAVGGLLALPDFGETRPVGATDFNDLHQAQGLESVRKTIGKALAVGDADDRPEIRNEPEPLRAPLPSAEPYPVDALGEVLGLAAKAINESVKAPLALCCQSVLAAASLATQAHCDIRLPWGERKPLSLFLLTVGVSGERKSGVDDLVLGAAKAQERIEMEFYANDVKEYEIALASWNHAAEAARKAATNGKKCVVSADQVRAAVKQCGEKPIPPIAPMRFVSDPTVEGLYKLLAISRPSVALFSDEGGLLIGGHALNSDNALKTMARWCKLWDGSPFDRVRAGDGAGILYGRRMAIHQLAQPDVMVTLLSDRMANGQGLLARCLVAWPESTIGTRQVDGFEWAGDRRELKRLFAVLKGLMEAMPRCGKTEQELDPVELPLSDEAKAMAVAASNQFETLMGKGADLAELTDRASKAVEQACRIAGVLAVIEGGLFIQEIGTEHLERGLILLQWYLAEALRIRGVAAIPQSVTDAEMLMTWLKSQSLYIFRSKQVLNRGPSPIRNKTRLMSAIAELIQNGYLVENKPGEVVEGVKTRKSWRVLHHVV
jgi:putative DNA primase/helicase